MTSQRRSFDEKQRKTTTGVERFRDMGERQKFFDELYETRGIEISGVQPEQKVFLFTISDKSEDRHGDTVDPKGWETSDYEKNPVVLFAHDLASPPVMHTKAILKDADRLRAVAVSLPPDIEEAYPFAKTVSSMYEHGIMRMTSVGFRPLEWEVRKGFEDAWWPPVDFKKQELTEYSVVPVGSNRNALLEAQAKSVDIRPLVEWAQRTLEEASGAGLWVPREDLEAVARGSSDRKMFVMPNSALENGEKLSESMATPREVAKFDVELFTQHLRKNLQSE
jgi:hypothetical protein